MTSETMDKFSEKVHWKLNFWVWLVQNQRRWYNLPNPRHEIVWLIGMLLPFKIELCLYLVRSFKNETIKYNRFFTTNLKQLIAGEVPITILDQTRQQHIGSCHSRYQGLLSPATECNSSHLLVLRLTTGNGKETSLEHTSSCLSMCEGLLSQ